MSPPYWFSSDGDGAILRDIHLCRCILLWPRSTKPHGRRSGGLAWPRCTERRYCWSLRQHQELERLARETGRSTSDLVREIVGGYLAQRSSDESRRLAADALAWLAASRREIQPRAGTACAFLH